MSKGISVMLCEIYGYERKGEPLLQGTIKSIAVTDDALTITFDDGTGYVFKDDGQSCCERRYMHSDDKPEEYVGAKFLSAEIADAPEIADEYGEHEVQFLRVHTDRGDFVCSAHNEHNGYYGGFCIHVEPLAHTIEGGT